MKNELWHNKRRPFQFVELRKFLPPYKATRPDEYDQAKAQLAKEVLYEIPNQLTDYMKSKGILPAPRELSRDDEPQERYPSPREGKHTSPHWLEGIALNYRKTTAAGNTRSAIS
jgi:hypothetical protein